MTGADTQTLVLMVDGKPVPPVIAENGKWQFVVPGCAGTLRLKSGTVSTAEKPPAGDRGPVGVCLTSVEARQGREITTLPLDHPDLGDGLYPVERVGVRLRRWTTGDTALPVARLSPDGQPFLLTIRGTGSAETVRA